jgi:glycosyltransferase involved in cell wall biosynthesis
MTEALAARGHEVRVLTTESYPEAEDYFIRTEVDSGVRIDRITLRYLVEKDPDGWQLGLRAWLRHERRIKEVLQAHLRNWRPDLIQYHTTRPFGEAGLMAIAAQGVPILAVLHEAWFICPRLMLLRSPTASPCQGPGPVKCLECMYSHYDHTHLRAAAKLSWRVPRLGVYPAYRIWRRRMARRALTGAFTYSRFMQAVHASHLPGRVEYLQIGINLAGLPSELPRRPRTPLRFGFFGGFQPNKGIWHVLDAAAAMKRDGLDFELLIWGPQDPRSATAIGQRSLGDRTHLKGMYGQVEMWDAYLEIDVAVMATTVSEPFGRIPVEAKAVGAPTIAPDIGGIGESIRDDIDGLLYRFQDPHDLERQMRRVLTERGLFERLSSELRPPIDTRTRGEALEKLYLSMLDSSSRERKMRLAA